MIKNKDRSHWFGASDTSMVVGNWNSDSFTTWWMTKLGFYKTGYASRAMDCGNILETQIIRKVEEITGEKIKIGKRPFYTLFLRVRVNYDGYKKGSVVEIKTTKKMFKKVPINYWRQCQVLMWRKKVKRCELWAYEMQKEDYKYPYFDIIDKQRLKCFIIEYDEDFIKKEYLPCVRILKTYLCKKELPKNRCEVPNTRTVSATIRIAVKEGKND